MTRPVVTIAIGEPLFQCAKIFILRTLEACDGNQSRTAKVLQINRNTLRARLAEYGVVR